MKYLKIELLRKPLTLNNMINIPSRFISGHKTTYFNHLEKFLDGLFLSKGYEMSTNAREAKDSTVYFKKFKEPLFVKPHIVWHMLCKTKHKRDRKNFIAGLKWLEDCLVSMNIISGDSVEDFKGEDYFLYFPVKESKVIIELHDKKPKKLERLELE